MARITISDSEDGTRVIVRGTLAAIDLRRLERACGRALERPTLNLELDLASVTAIDAAAEAFVRRLIDRGARIVESYGGLPTPHTKR